jgi:hypothetical protein
VGGGGVNDEEIGVRITFKAMYDQLQQLVTELRDLNATMKAHENTKLDHEIRLRNLERWRYALPASLSVSAVSIMTALASLIGR